MIPWLDHTETPNGFEFVVLIIEEISRLFAWIQRGPEPATWGSLPVTEIRLSHSTGPVEPCRMGASAGYNRFT